MNAEQEIYDGLTAAPAIAAFVPDERIYPDIAAQDAPLPLIVFERTSTEAIATIHEGAPVASKVVVSVSAWANSRVEAEDIADAMQIALTLIGTTANRFSHYDAEVRAYAAVVDFEVWEL